MKKQIPSKTEIIEVISNKRLLYKCCEHFNCNVGTFKKWLRIYDINIDFSKNSVLPEILQQRGNTKKQNRQKTIICKYCKNEFNVPNFSKKQFCSLRCFYNWKSEQPKQMIKYLCAQCNKIFYKYPSLCNDENNFCSYNCMYEYRKGKTYLELYGEEKGNKIKEKLVIASSENNINNPVYFTKPHQLLKNELIKQNLYEGFKSMGIVKYFEIDELNEQKKLCVEVDGDYWHSLDERKKRDFLKDKKLKEWGYTVLRFWEHEIYENLENCIIKIKQKL